MTIRRLKAKTRLKDRELKDLRDRLQMALELGGPKQVLDWGNARLAMVMTPESRDYLLDVLDGVQRDIQRPMREAEKQLHMQLRPRAMLLNMLHKAERRAVFREGIAADRDIEDSIGPTTPFQRHQWANREQARLEQRQRLVQQRIEQEQARRRGGLVQGRWQICR